MSHSQSRWLAPALLCVALSCNIYAVDGVVLIDQNRALAGNVTPGDAPGFPVTISQPGSYRLQGNLTVSGALGAIEITSSNVVFDLNGFNISCECRFSTVGHDAVLGVGALRGISMRNGSITVTGEGLPVNLNGQTLNNVQDLVVTGTILVGQYSIVRRNLGDGLQIKCPSVILENVLTNALFEDHGVGFNCATWHNRSVFDTTEIRQ